MSNKKVIVCQLGARRQYAVPLALYRAGLLSCFYTDFCIGNTWLTRCVGTIDKQIQLNALSRLQGRMAPGLPSELIRTFPILGVQYKRRVQTARDRWHVTEAWLWGGTQFGDRVARAGLDDAGAVFAYSSAALEIFESARKAGLRRILDLATAPRRAEMELVMQQADTYPGWATAPGHDPWLAQYDDRQRAEADLADVIICGSSFARDLVDTSWAAGEKCVVVPLGLPQFPENVRGWSPHGGPLRVLFVGDEALRKGIGDLHVALKQLGPTRFAVKVAGQLDLTVLARTQLGETMELLGRVLRRQLSGLYQWADLLVLPSVSDTFGLTLLESLSHGVPVVATTHTGAVDIVSDGREGYVIPPRAPALLAQILGRVEGERQQLATMSRAAIDRSRRFGMEQYAKGLVAAMAR